MRRTSRVLLLMSLFLTTAIVWILFFLRTPLNESYNTFGDDIPDEFPVLGIDISHYQGEINWGQLKNMRIDGDSVEFVFIKATEGISVEDDRKRVNAFGARSVEIDYGFYHFFIPNLSARKQAHYFCEEIGGYNFDLKPVIDVEIETDYSAARLLDSIQVFLDVVEQRLAVRPIIYTYYSFYMRYFRSINELFWVARYGRNCPAMDHDNVICWQFSETGTVDGINECVDLNVAKENFFEKISRW